MSARILTFDVEDWFHLLDCDVTRLPSDWARYESRIEASTGRILEELARRELKATFFCLGWVAEHYPDLIRRIAAAGHEIGTHSFAHQLVYEQSPREFRADLQRSIHLLEELTGKAVRMYRAPGFSIRPDSQWALDILLEEGIEVDCSIFPVSRAHGGYADLCRGPSWLECRAGRLKEMPLNFGRILGRQITFSGGGYFRLLPYPLIRQQINQSDYVMTYFHPRDFDAGQPVIKGLSPSKRFKSYVGLEGAFRKLSAMLDDFAFVTVGQAVEAVDWNQAPAIRVTGGPSGEMTRGKLVGAPTL